MALVTTSSRTVITRSAGNNANRVAGNAGREAWVSLASGRRSINMSEMRFWLCISAVLFAAAAFGRTEVIAPLPETEQATLALKVLDAFHGQRAARPPKLLRVVYFTPADREPVPRYQERLTAIMADIGAFYQEELTRHGFGPMTFELERDAAGKLVIHLVRGKQPDAGYPRTSWGASDGGDGDKVLNECLPTIQAAGISPADETILVFCNLANWDEKAHTYSHHSPFLWCLDPDAGPLLCHRFAHPGPWQPAQARADRA